MSKTLQMRRGSTTEHLTFTGSEGELTVDTTKQTAVIHNGVNAGGQALAKEDLSNVSQSSITSKGIAKNDLSNIDMENLQNVAKNDLSNVSAGSFLQFELAKNDLVSAQSATETNQGAIKLATKDESILGENATKAITPKTLSDKINSFFTLNSELKPKLPIGLIQGLIPENHSSDVEHDLTISTGRCRDVNDSADIILESPITKKMDTAWNEGDQVGGLASVLTISANTTYHMFLIAKETGEVDAGFDTDIDASNLFLDATEYTKYRRVFSFKTDGSNNIPLFNAYQTSGGGLDIEYNFGIQDVSETDNANIDFAYPLSVPARSVAKIGVKWQTSRVGVGEQYCTIKNGDITNSEPSSTNFHLAVRDGTAENLVVSGAMNVETNNSSQVYVKAPNVSGALAKFIISTNGYVDTRVL